MGPEWAEEVPQSGPHPPGEGFRVPDVKCFEGQSGRVEGGGWDGATGEETGETDGEEPALETLPPGPSGCRAAPESQLGTLRRL